MLKHQCPGISHLSRDISLYPSLFHVHHTAWRAALTAAAVGSSPPADETIVRAIQMIQLCLARALALAQGRCATARLSSYGSSIRPASRGGANLERAGKPSRARISPQYRHRRGRGGKVDVDRTVLRCHDWAGCCAVRTHGSRAESPWWMSGQVLSFRPFVVLRPCVP